MSPHFSSDSHADSGLINDKRNSFSLAESTEVLVEQRSSLSVLESTDGLNNNSSHISIIFSALLDDGSYRSKAFLFSSKVSVTVGAERIDHLGEVSSGPVVSGVVVCVNSSITHGEGSDRVTMRSVREREDSHVLSIIFVVVLGVCLHGKVHCGFVSISD